MNRESKPKFDIPLPEQAIDEMVNKFAGEKIEALTSVSFFEGKQSAEFYKGMEAAYRSVLNAIETFPIRHLTGVISDMQIVSMIKSKEKRSPLILGGN